jgi:transposase
MRTTKEVELQERVDELTAERDLWAQEAKRWRDMYMEYDEMLEDQVQSAADRLDKVWEDLDKLKKQIQDELHD